MANPKGATAKAALRRLDALDYRKDGLSYRAIADKLGISSAQAYRDLKTALVDLTTQQHESAAELRGLHLLRLEAMYLSLQSGLEAVDLKTIDAAINILKREADLFGLNAPKKQELSAPTDTAFKVYIQTAEFNPDDA